MSEKYQLSSESDEDEDYIPEGQDILSEVESEVDSDITLDDDNHESQKNTNGSKVRKRCKNMKNNVTKRKKVQGNAVTRKKVVGKECAEDVNKAKLLSEEEEKKRADFLWADFMKDAALVSNSKSGTSTANSLSEKFDSALKKPKVEDKIKITKTFDFAGEIVEIEKEVLADSSEARLLSVTKNRNIAKNADILPATEKREAKDRGIRKIGLGAISSVLGQLGKKSKISTLEKSKLDWDNFKKQENIEEEINTYNKGKDGYLEKQDFLQRADFRQFEIEKQLRNSRRSNR